MLFSRRRKDPAQAIAGFWRWWPTASARAATSVSAGWSDEFVREISQRVAAVHKGLQWEFAPGASAKHAFVVTSAGDPTLRATAERWRAAAPPADETWEFHSARQPAVEVTGHRVTFQNREIELSDLQFALHLDRARGEVDVVAFHPLFALMSTQDRLKLTFLTLDWTLGEAAVGIWIGAVGTSIEPPERPQTVRGLRAAVGELTDNQVDDSWAILGGLDSRGVPLIASIQTPLKAARWPRFDTHVAVAVPFRYRLENGFPADESLAALRAFEEHVIAAVRRDGALVAHETSNGRRTLHVYVDGASGAAGAIRRVLPGWPDGRGKVTAKCDPRWKGIAHLRA